MHEKQTGNFIARRGRRPRRPERRCVIAVWKIAEKYIRQFSEFYENITVDQYVIMPDHVHIVLFVENGGSPRTSTPTRQTASVSLFVSTLKRFCNKEYGENVWQRGFYDHVIRGQEDYEEIVKYILENPARCYYGKLYTEE